MIPQEYIAKCCCDWPQMNQIPSFQITNDDGSTNEMLMKLENMNKVGSKSIVIENFNLKQFLSPITNLKKAKFYRYEGSLTTPPCSETVTWTIFPHPLRIAKNLMEEFRKQKIEGNAESNFRKVRSNMH